MTHSVALIPGDGVGPELTDAVRRVIAAAGVAIEWDVRLMGVAALDEDGVLLPEPTVASIRERGVALKGPVNTPVGSGVRSVNTALRRELDLYLSVRPCRSFRGGPAFHAHEATAAASGPPSFDVVVARMTHEDLYAGLEYATGSVEAGQLLDFFARTMGTRLASDTGISIKPISATETGRAARAICGWAEDHGRRKLTIVHKASVMHCTDGLFLQTARAVAQREFPGLAVDERLVDSVCHDLVTRPESCDVLFAPMLYGDILADLCAALIGGLGLAPGVNLGDRCAVFEAVHGTAPRLAGRDRANPMALILCGAMLLRHLGEDHAAARVERSVEEVILDGRTLTYDLRAGRNPGSGAATSAVCQAVIAKLQ